MAESWDEKTNWGLRPTWFEPRMYFGARASISTGHIKLIKSQESVHVVDGVTEEEWKDFMHWIREVALPIADHHVVNMDDNWIDLRGEDKGYRLVAKELGNGRFLDIGAYTVKEEKDDSEFGG